VRAIPGHTHVTLFPESFKDFQIKSLIDSLSGWHKFRVDDPLTVKKKMSIDLILDLLILAFLGRGVCGLDSKSRPSGSPEETSKLLPYYRNLANILQV